MALASGLNRVGQMAVSREPLRTVQLRSGAAVEVSALRGHKSACFAIIFALRHAISFYRDNQ